jgi:hypothetical protein
MLSTLDPLVEKRLKNLAGEHFRSMRQSLSTTLHFLTDPEPKLRQAAIGVAFGILE